MNDERELLESLSYLLDVRELDTTQDEKNNTTNAFFNTLTQLGVEPDLAMKIAVYVIKPYK